MSYTLGIDFGTNSVRAIVVRLRDGKSMGTGIFNYPSGKDGVLVDPKDPHCARQNPADYHEGLLQTVKVALETAAAETAKGGEDVFSADQVIGIGVDTTGSSPIPVDRENRPLALDERWKDNLAAQCWLWKDHTSAEEAALITEKALAERPQYMARCGNTYSSEWFWSKIWHCLKIAPDVFDNAHSWVELSDYIPALLCGVNDPLAVRRGVCAAGHKAMYADDWGGLPDKEFLSRLDPKLASLRDRLYERAYDQGEPAGTLCAEWAKKLGLAEGIPVAMGAFDVHYGAIGSGVEEGVLVKAMGTSTCDCGVMKFEGDVQDIPGICGIVKGSILPGYYGLEAGQSAVGDIFKWWVETVCQGSGETYARLQSEAEQLAPGEHGLLALDWNNGNRTILVDPYLTGLMVGLTLHSSQAEIYRALIEGTAFGARVILERLKEYGVPVERVVCCGGLAEKNALLMQIYADITGCVMQVSRSDQSCALGAALTAAVLAGVNKGGYDSFEEAQAAMTGVKEGAYHPDPEAQKIYDEVFGLYRKLHDGFGGLGGISNMGDVMKKLLQIQKQAKANK